MRKVQRYIVRFVCSNGRVRYCGENGHMPYQRNAAEMYASADECYARMDLIPRSHLMRNTTPEILAKTALIPDTREPVTCFGLLPHAA